jgi:ubiquinone/menaquinone biosynthesis C-methylase UbiE
MARITYDQRTAAAFKEVREVPMQGLEGWRQALRAHLRLAMTVLDLGAGTGAFATAFRDWFDVKVVAVEPSADMRARIPQRPGISVLEGHAAAIPLEDACCDAAWLSTVIHHVPDLEAAAHEIRRVLRKGAPVLIRSVFPGRSDRLEIVRWFPETERMLATYPTVERVCEVFAAAGFEREALEAVPQDDSSTLDELLARMERFREADTLMRSLTDEEFEAGRGRLRRADDSAVRTSWLDLLVLR